MQFIRYRLVRVLLYSYNVNKIFIHMMISPKTRNAKPVLFYNICTNNVIKCLLTLISQIGLLGLRDAKTEQKILN